MRGYRIPYPGMPIAEGVFKDEAEFDAYLVSRSIELAIYKAKDQAEKTAIIAAFVEEKKRRGGIRVL